MSLKQLMLSKKLKRNKTELTELRSGLDARSSELEKALEEASTDEEVQVVEDEVQAFEDDKAEKDKTIADLEAEIESIEAELEALNEHQPEAATGASTQERSNQTQTVEKTRGNGQMIITRGFFKGQERSRVTDLVNRSEVKEFLSNLRQDISGQKSNKRSVVGLELTIPVVVIELLRDNLHRYSQLISRVNLKALTGTGRVNVVGDVPEAIWTEACATLNELDLTINQVEVDGFKVGGYVSICNAVVEDSDINVLSEVLDLLGRSIGVAVDKAILYGTGRKMPTGIVTSLAQTAEPETWSQKAPAWVDLSSTNIGQVAGDTPQEKFANLIRFSGKAKGNYGAGTKFWAMNETTLTELKAQLLTFNAAGAIVSAVNETMPVINGDVVILPFMADGDIVGGYGSQYILAERAGFQFASSTDVQFIEDNVVYKGTARYDGKPINRAGFIAVNIDGAAPKTSLPFAPDTANEEDVPAGA